MGVLSKAAEWLETQRHKHMTVEVQYKRSDLSLTLQATIGKTIFETADDYGHVTKTESRDFLIRASDLVFDGKTTTPEDGDRIIEGGFIYEVMSPVNKPKWRYSDINRQTLRVHTKQTGTIYE